MVGRIYEGDHLTLLNTKYLSPGPHGFREEDFFFPIISMRANEPQGVAILDPRGMVGRIYVGDHLTLLNTKYLRSGPHGFREEDFFLSFSHYRSMRANEPQGVAIWDPRGMVGRIYVGYHFTLLHTKYLSSGPHSFREEVFLIICLWEIYVAM